MAPEKLASGPVGMQHVTAVEEGYDRCVVLKNHGHLRAFGFRLKAIGTTMFITPL
jgi:hypothetical protein